MIKKTLLASAPCTVDGKPLPGFISGSIEMEFIVTIHSDTTDEKTTPTTTIIDSTATVIDDDTKLLSVTSEVKQ
jgi:hypothetical protein